MYAFFSQHLLEILATLSGLLNIYLAVRTSLWNWFFGMITVSLYFIIFYQVKLYADMSLQCVFFLMQFYGLYQWLYGGRGHTALSVDRASLSDWINALFANAILFVNIAFILWRYTDSTTIYIDALTTALSLVAQWMMSKKWIENWWLWILVNIISINMYVIKGLYFTSGLYAIFIFLNVLGFRAWKLQLVHRPLTETQSVSM